MLDISVVIIGKNEAHIIGETIRRAQTITNDVIVVDSGSTDDSPQIIIDLKATLLQTSWDGYGQNKNKGIALAKHPWILSIDADEHADAEMVKAISRLVPPNEYTVYRIARKNFLGNKQIRYGEWASDAPIRLFNKKTVQWNHDAVHEQLKLPPGSKVEKIGGSLLHYTIKDLADYAQKTTRYAMLGASLYYHRGKKAGFIKRRISPGFAFFSNYILKRGFLDGKEGYLIAKMTAFYTFLKYQRLYELHHNSTG